MRATDGQRLTELYTILLKGTHYNVRAFNDRAEALKTLVEDRMQPDLLTEPDMLGLFVLNAHDKNISNLAGLEAARNLNTLLLFSNHLTNFSLPTLTNLVSLNLSANSLTNISLPAGMTQLFSLLASGNPPAKPIRSHCPGSRGQDPF